MTLDDTQQRFMTLFEPQRNALWRFVRSMVRTPDDAEDLMSETVLQAFEGFTRLKDEQAFTSFLFTIASRLYRRHRWRRSWFGTYDEQQAENIAHSDPRPDDLADVTLLRQALQRLPAKQREAVVLFDVLGLSLQEVRDVQGGTLSGVKSRLLRARRDLARMLDCSQPMPTPDHGTPQTTPPIILQCSTTGEVTPQP